MNKAKNTLDYDPANPDHEHIRRRIGQRMAQGFVIEHLKATTRRPSYRDFLFSTASIGALHYGTRT